MTSKLVGEEVVIHYLEVNLLSCLCGGQTVESHENFGTRSRPGMSFLTEIWTLGFLDMQQIRYSRDHHFR